LSIVWPINLQKLAQTGKLGRIEQTALNVLQTARQPQVKHQGLFGIKICVPGMHHGCVPSQHDTRDFFFLIIIILEPQTSIITSVVMLSFPLIISITLHTDLWKLAPYFKKIKEKKKSLLLYCMLQKNYRL
jgi:hypothetical protein